MIRKVHHPDGDYLVFQPPGRQPARRRACRERPGGQVRERDVLDDLAQVLAQRDPHALQRLGRTGVGHALGALAAHGGERAVDGADHVRDADLRRRPAQPVPALGPAHALHDARRGAGRRGCSPGSAAGCPGRWRSPRRAAARPCAGRRRARRRRGLRSRPWRRPSRRRCVPARDHAVLALEAELGERGGVEREARAALRRQLEPAGGEHAQDVAVGEQRDVAVGARARGRSRGRRARRPARASRRRASRRATASSRAAPRGSRASCAPRSRRSRSRRGPGRSPGSKPASAAVSRARARGELSTSANSRPSSRSPSARAAARPASVSGMSVVEVCWPDSLHSVCAVADEHDPHRAYLRASASTASAWRSAGAGPACSSTTNALPSRISRFCQPTAVPR